jgi:hypothetical protein
MKGWLLKTFFGDIASYLRMNASYPDHTSFPARDLCDKYGIKR